MNMDVQFQSQAEMDAMLALVIAVFNNRRRVGCTGSSLRDFMPSSELECSWAGCLVYFTPNIFAGSLPLSRTMTIFFF